MRRILCCALFAIALSAPILLAEDLTPAIASLADLSHRGQITQVIDTANSLLAANKLAPADQAMALVYLGYAYQELGNFTNATASYEKGLAILEKDVLHQADYAGILALLATVYAQTGQVETAKHMMLRSVHLFGNESNHTEAAMVWTDLATIAADQHSRSDAHKYIARSIAESQFAGNLSPVQLAALATTQGRIADMDGDPHTAIHDYQHAIDLRNQAHQDPDGTAWLNVLIGAAYLQAGDIASARESTSRGLSQLEATSGRQTVRYHLAEINYAKILDASGAHEEASTLRKQAQSALNTATDLQRSRSQISISALR